MYTKGIFNNQRICSKVYSNWSIFVCINIYVCISKHLVLFALSLLHNAFIHIMQKFYSVTFLGAQFENRRGCSGGFGKTGKMFISNIFIHFSIFCTHLVIRDFDVICGQIYLLRVV